MDKEELAYKIAKSAEYRSGVLLDDKVITEVVAKLLDDYSVIGDSDTRGDWDWWGYVTTTLSGMDAPVRVIVNVYGEEWAGAGKWSMVAFARGDDKQEGSKQQVGKASFCYHTSYAITCVANQGDPVQVILDKLTMFSGVMCDHKWRENVVRTIVDYPQKEVLSFNVPLNDEVTVHVKQLVSHEVSFFVWAGYCLIGSAIIDDGIFWDTLLP